MSTARHHAEWLSLVETSGPFLSMPVLTRVFPQGLDPRDAERSSRLREAYEEWLDSGQKAAMHHAWIRQVLTGFLGYEAQFLVEGQAIPAGIEASMANYGETLRPDFVLKRPGVDEKPVLLIEMHPAEQDLNKPVPSRVWKASPATRMMELLHATNIPVGLVTNGEQWMLVFAPRGETTGFASWYADLWMQEPITLRAFQNLLQQSRFLGVADGETLPALLAESGTDQQEVTDQLGLQVRHAVEMLVHALDRLDEESGRQLLREVSEKDLYNGALTVMMRLVFLFTAEERGLLLLGDPLYDQHYAVSTLSQLLRERADQHGEEVLERRQDAWCRLLSTFRGVHGGIEHEALRLPPYGGTLFDPDRFPFLEGRAPGTSWRVAPARPLAINNRVVLHLLESLQVLRVKVPGGGPAETRRLSFRALDIEQIGHVYEGLLDHTAKRASEVVLGLAGGKGREPEIALSRLEDLAGVSGADLLEPEFSSSEPHLMAADAPGKLLTIPRATGSATYQPEARLIEFLKEETGRSEKALTKALTEPAKIDQNRLFLACGRDRVLFDRVSRFAGLLRSDDFDQPVVIRGGSVFVTSGSDRRSTGTHYTPRSLTEPIVQHTLEPLVYIGPAEGAPNADWRLKTPREILALKVCDMAMGSGAFLVQTCRYLAERLVEAWENAEQANPGKILATPEGDFSSGDPAERIIPADATERLAIARRYVADRCLCGVDINPMAVEMAKLSLWLITLQRDRPFTFLDHALKCGDSLLGVSRVKQVENFTLRTEEGQYAEMTFGTANLFRCVEQAGQKRRELEDLPSNDHTQIETKHRLHTEAEAATAKVKVLADCLIALELRGLDGDAYADAREAEADQVQRLLKQDADASLKSPVSNQQSALAGHAQELLRGRRPFHWPVEFPEVFARGGFDAFVGNPPYLGGKRIRTELGDVYGTGIKTVVTPGEKGAADLSAYFVRRSNGLNTENGLIGFVLTNTIAEGDTRIIGLDRLLKNSTRIIFAKPNMPWPGTAGVTVSVVILRRGIWNGLASLDGRECKTISSFLECDQNFTTPFPLAQSPALASTGTSLNGEGFIVTTQDFKLMVSADARNREVLLPYLVADDLNTLPDQKASRFVINFGEMNESSAAEYELPMSRVRETVKPARDKLTNQIHETCYWKHWDKRPALYHALSQLKFALVGGRVTKHVSFSRIPTGSLFSDRLIVVASSRFDLLAVLQSALHSSWVEQLQTSMGETIGYSVSKCYTTFPWPELLLNGESTTLVSIGSRYDELRQQIMVMRQGGLTKTYNRFHNRGEQSTDIARLRALHVEMDQAVAAAYGWSDLDLGHGFHTTKQGERFTISEPARRTVLDRLLALNHQRYAEEVAAGLHEKGAKKSKGRKAKASEPDLTVPQSRPQMDLL
jgi:hypothetical protein